jgi:hypothetical protein
VVKFLIHQLYPCRVKKRVLLIAPRAAAAQVGVGTGFFRNLDKYFRCMCGCVHIGLPHEFGVR